MVRVVSIRSGKPRPGKRGLLLPVRFAALFMLFLCVGFWIPRGQGATDLESLLPQAQQLILKNDLSGAHRLLSSAIEEFPSDARVPNLLGVVEAQRGNYEAAERSFQSAIALVPNFIGAYVNLGRLYQQHVNDDPKALGKGLGTYRTLLQYEPNNLQAIYQIAVLLMKSESYEESLDSLSRLPADAQQRAMVLSVRCADLAGLHRLSEAGETANQLLGSADLTELDVLSILPILAKSERLGLETRLLEGLAERGMASFESKRQLAVLYERQDKLDLARKVLEESVSQASNLVPVLLELARIAYKQKDFEGALGYLAHARDLEPKNAGIHFFFGMVCVELDLVLDAKDSLEKALNLAPDRPYYNYALGAVTIRDKDSSEAVKYFSRYRELKPEDPRGRFALGLALYHNAGYEKAREELDAAAQSPETAAGAHYYLGRIPLQTHDHSEAIAHFKQAIEANPDFADAYADLGLAYTREKRYELARKTLERAVELDPEGYRPNMNLLVLYQRTRDERAAAQREKFNLIKEKRSEATNLLLRRVEFRPYE